MADITYTSGIEEIVPKQAKTRLMMVRDSELCNDNPDWIFYYCKYDNGNVIEMHRDNLFYARIDMPADPNQWFETVKNWCPNFNFF